MPARSSRGDGEQGKRIAVPREERRARTGHDTGRATPPAGGTIPLHVAVVHGGSGICHVAAATSAADLTNRLGEYVRGQAKYQLWPEETKRVLELLAAGRPQEAVEYYFSSVGPRWGLERLALTQLELPLPADPRAALPDGTGRFREAKRE